MTLEVQTNQMEPDYSSQEVISGILAKGDPSELEKLAERFAVTTEKITLYSQFAKLRRETQSKMKAEAEKRIQGEFNPTPEEKSLGAYKEMLEPQVRDAVLTLREKGYSTIESGFVDVDAAQNIRSLEPVFKDVILEQGLVENLASRGARIELNPNEIILHFDRFVPLDEIKDMWQKIAEVLPDLGYPAPAKTPNARKLVGLSSFFEE